MFEIEQKNADEIIVTTKENAININVVQSLISAKLAVGEIAGPGEFEIGETAIRAIESPEKKVMYLLNINGITIGIVGGVENGLDDLGPIDILCTSSLAAIKTVEPKIAVLMDNVEAIDKELKVELKKVAKLKIKNEGSLPAVMETYSLR